MDEHGHILSHCCPNPHYEYISVEQRGGGEEGGGEEGRRGGGEEWRSGGVEEWRSGGGGTRKGRRRRRSCVDAAQVLRRAALLFKMLHYNVMGCYRVVELCGVGLWSCGVVL